MEPAVKRDERILIIDDQSLSQSFLRYALEQLGYQNIALADRAQTALQLCRQNSYDLVICDYNLSKGKDGYHLFDELKTRGLHKPACGVIFISADTDPALVHSVLELQPDEFMAKPFVIRDLQQRIERVLKRKQLLRPVYDLLEQNAPDKALQHINIQLGKTELHKLFPLLLKIKGDILLQQANWDDATVFFAAMLQIQPFSWARIGQVRCLLQQGHEQQAFAELEKMLKRQETRLFALDNLSELEFHQQRYQQAQQHILAAANIAPRNLLRQQKLLQLSRLNHDYEIQYRAARDMVKFARNSIYEQPDLYLNMARASIDFALSTEDTEQQSRLNRQATLSLNMVQHQFASHKLTEQQQVLQARLMYLQDHRDKARQLLAELEPQPEITSLEDALDKAKALHEVGLADASKQLFRQITEHCRKQQPEPVFMRYLHQEQQERERMPQGPRELNNNAVRLYQHGNWQEAFAAFVMAAQVMPKNAGIALNLLQTLLTAPRQLCPPQQRQNLLQQCQQLIDSSKLKAGQQERYLQLRQKYLNETAV
ncbi:DNA-binding response regulator, OmpR family, contains REC and winged-helix (wHTH) domain [Rheinheimera pacifica]|uniref:DNA-binding response regulator, OmpR family, contains REC and winged-helix (WHTH) domain n=1 Tax=Rheinheimera pacifica TaxID=173990 RepID=A0A1H6KU83_9GAMM|nr:response regulator [Rheinheimera pacifica]SEH79136.1 DNA-binding response regulator, OmpR family, contains REC and winged-helix (wHTH) domain [Rheinheimera pacifica]